MPTIHIHTLDADLLGTILTLVYDTDPTVDVSFTPEPYDRVTRVTRSNDLVTRAVQRAATLDVVDTIDEWEQHKRRDHRDARELARYERCEACYDEFNAVPCPRCGAQSTQPCARPDGSYYERPYVHVLRQNLAQAHQTTNDLQWVGQVVTLDEMDDYPERAADDAALDQAEATGWTPF